MIKRQTTMFDGDCEPMDDEKNIRKIEELKVGFMNFADRMNDAKDDSVMSLDLSIQFSSSSASQDGVEITAQDPDGGRETQNGLFGGFAQGLFDNFKLDEDVLNELMESRHFGNNSDRSIGRGKPSSPDYVINQLPESKNTVDFLLKKVSHHFLSQSSIV